MKRVKPQIYIYGILVVVLLAVAGFFANDVKKGVNKGMDLQGGYEIVFKVDHFESEEELPSEAIILKSVQKRLHSLGFSDAKVEFEGKNIRVKVGSDRPLEEVVKLISTTAKLTFRDASDVLITDASILVEGGASVQFQGKQPVVVLRVNNYETFYRLTYTLSQQTSKIMVTWLDFIEGVDNYQVEAAKAAAGETPKYISAAMVTAGIDGDAVISGNFTEEEAQYLVDQINAGSLPVKLTKIYSTSFDSLLKTKTSNNILMVGIVALVAIMFIFILKYRLLGFTLATLLPGLLLLSIYIYNSMKGVVNVHSSSALVLGVLVFVAITAILFENFISEMRLGKKLEAAYTNAKKNTLPIVVDVYVIVLIFAGVLFFFSSGIIKSFAMLLLTIIACTIVASYLLRLLIGFIVKSNAFEENKGMLGVVVENDSQTEGSTTKSKLSKLDFSRIKKYCFGISIALAVIAIVVVAVRPLSFGYEFSGSTKLVVIAEEAIDSAKIINEIAEFGFKTKSSTIVDESDKGIEITFTEKISSKDAARVINDLKTIYGDNVEINSTNPVSGRNTTESVLLLVGITLVIAFAYIAIRYGIDYSYSVLLVNAHDVLVAIFVILATGLTIDNSVLVLLLAVVSWSIACGFIVSSFISSETKQYKNEKRLKESLPQFANKVSTELAKNSIWVIIVIALLAVSSFALVLNTAIFCYIAVLMSCVLVCAYSSIVILPNAWVSLHKKTDNDSKDKKKGKAKKRKKAELEEYLVPGINDIR